MKIIKIVDRKTGKEIMQLNYEMQGMSYHTVAMYAMAAVAIIKNKDVEALLSLITNLKNDTMDEEELIEIFLQEFDVNYEDVDRRIEKALTAEEIFGK